MTDAPPPAGGTRLPWSDVPDRVRSALKVWLGAPIVSAVNQPGGFSPGPAARVETSDGRRVFVKAVGPELNPDSPAIFRREAQIVAALPAEAPTPRLLWTCDEGEGGWVMLVFEWIEGWAPTQPWKVDELDRVMDALVSLGEVLTPAPIAAPPARDHFLRSILGWQKLRDEPTDRLDEWSRRHLHELADLEPWAPGAVSGETLLQFDVRADNVLLTPECVYIVDWPHACIGAAWVDIVGFAPSVAMQGGLEPEELLRRHPAALRANPDDITAAVASVAGYFTRQSFLPPPPGIPTVRAFQAAQGVEARRWLAVRTGWI